MNATSKKITLKNLKLDVDTLKKSLLNFNFQKSTGQLENTSVIKKSRRKIASLKTSINQQREKKDA